MGYLETALKGYNERVSNGEVVFIPELIEEITSKPAPDFNIPVEMPLINFYFGIRKARAGMHTDMLLSLCRTMEQMQPETLEKMFIEGRLLTLEQWTELEQSKPYRFFYNRRFGRTAKAAKDEGVLDLVLPLNHELADEEIEKLGLMELTVHSLSDTVIPFKTGWIPMAYLLEQYHISKNPNVLLPFIGAVNKFTLGTTELVPGKLESAKAAIEEGMRAIDSLKSVDLASIPSAVYKQKRALTQL